MAAAVVFEKVFPKPHYMLRKSTYHIMPGKNGNDHLASFGEYSLLKWISQTWKKLKLSLKKGTNIFFSA